MDPLDFFPYKARGDQAQVIKKLYSWASEGERILFHAPTGYGKTPVILSALLPLSLEFDLPIIWAVRTGGETDRVIEELAKIKEYTGEQLFGFSLRGKKDMCLLARDLGFRDYDAVNELCNKMKRKCRYYATPFNPLKYVSAPLLFSEILDIGYMEGVCPYYAQFKLIEHANVISLNYNYILLDRFNRVLWRKIRRTGSLLVVDEAHNLDRAVSELYSIKISLETVKRSINEAKLYLQNEDYFSELYLKLLQLHDILLSEANELKTEDAVFDPLKITNELDLDDDFFISLEKAADKIISLKLSRNKVPRSSIRRLSRFLMSLYSSLGERGIEYIKYKDKERVYFEIWDLRVEEILSELWGYFEAIVFTSGTLKPYDAFADVVGLDSYKILEGYFPVDPENVLPIIVRGVTTKGEELEENMINKYASLIDVVVSNFDKNLAIFFSSYRIKKYFIGFLRTLARQRKRYLIEETEDMKGDEVREVVYKFRKMKNGVLAGVMGGKFAEGLDFPGETLEGILLIGIPFDRVNYRTEARIRYFSEIFGEEKGRYYAYIVPALRKASQAMGRGLRSPKDRALIIAADERYTYPKYFNLLPDFFIMNVKIVKSLPLLINYIKAFTGGYF